jgi:APA family basic amino acid/polyamine antiporter
MSSTANRQAAPVGEEAKRTLGCFDATMLVAGSMIGSGIFIVSAEMARQVGSPGWLLVAWLITGLLTMAAALSYAELAAMMPRAGGQYVYLREAWSPLLGFLYGWTLFLVIQTGLIAAVAVAFARFLEILWPWAADHRYLIPPIHLSSRYAVSLSTGQAVAVLLIALLTWTNIGGLKYGKLIQNLFTSAKLGALLIVIVLGVLIGWNVDAVRDNFGNLWEPRGYTPTAPGLSPETLFGLMVALGVAQVGSLFSSDAWNNVTFTAGSIRDPQRNLPRALAAGTLLVIGIYLCANLAYLVVLPWEQIQTAPNDRVAAVMLDAMFPSFGAAVMAVAILISTFGCINALVMSGGWAYYTMARDGLFFRRAEALNRAQVPGVALAMQGVWASALVLIRTHDPATQAYGNLYNNLLDYTVSAALLFYVLTVAGVFRLRWLRPDVPRPYRAFGYPIVPAFYICGAVAILGTLLAYRPATTLPGFLMVLLGAPVYFVFRRKSTQALPA